MTDSNPKEEQKQSITVWDISGYRDGIIETVEVTPSVTGVGLVHHFTSRGRQLLVDRPGGNAFTKYEDAVNMAYELAEFAEHKARKLHERRLKALRIFKAKKDAIS
ncbi:hypothetical protein ACI2KR_06805 [Pseudomonas luteola]